MKKQLWTPARINTLRTMWSEGRTRTAIAAVLGCSNTAVRSEIAKLNLPARGDGRIRIPKQPITRELRGGIASTMKAREEDETRVVKLATLSFQSNRLSWE